jgi:hypothetical protein
LVVADGEGERESIDGADPVVVDDLHGRRVSDLGHVVGLGSILQNSVSAEKFFGINFHS